MDLAGAPPTGATQPLRAKATQHRQRRWLPSAATPRLSVVVVNYRDWEGTAALARQVLRTAAGRKELVEMVVVDNHSPVHALTRRMRRWPGLSLRRWGRNKGFARAANEGCRLSRGDWFLILNPDVTLAPAFIDGVLQLTTEQGPHVGIVGFQLRNCDGSEQLSTGPFPSLLSTVTRLALSRCRRKYAAATRGPVDWVTGCCLLVRKDCLQQLGGFDPEFFLYYEDVDLCRRAWQAGWSVCFEPRLWAIHQRPLHSRSVPAPMRVVTRHALLTYAVKHWRPWQVRLLGGIVRLEAGLRRLRASWEGKGVEAKAFAALGGIAGALVQGKKRRAQRQLRSVVRQVEASNQMQDDRSCPSPL